MKKIFLLAILGIFFLNFISASYFLESHGQTITGTSESQAGKSGIQIQVNSKIYLLNVSVNMAQATDPTYCYILDASKNVLVNSSIDGSGIAVFDSYELSAGGTYFLAVDRGGSAYSITTSSSATGYQYTGTKINWTAGLNWNGDVQSIYAGWLFSIESAYFSDSLVSAPTITLNSPVNNFNSSSPSNTFNASVVATNGIVNVSWYKDGVLNSTNTSGFNNTDYIFTKNISEGNHNWTIGACSSTMCSNATWRNITIDSTAPVVHIVSPANNFYWNNLTTNFTANITDATIGDGNLELYIWNSTGSRINRIIYNKTYDISATISSVYGISYSNNYFYAIGTGTNNMKKFFTNWTYAGTTYNPGTNCNSDRDINTDGNYWWITCGSYVLRYYYSNVSLVDYVDLSSQGISSISSLGVDDNYFYISDSFSPQSSFKYFKNWTYISVRGTEANLGNQLFFDGTYFYESILRNIFRLNTDFDFTSFSYNTDYYLPSGTNFGLIFVNNSIYTSSWNSTGRYIHQFEINNGISLLGTSNLSSQNFSFLSEGNYTIGWKGLDYLNNSAWNSEGNYTIIIDITKPKPLIQYPANTTYATNISELNYSFTELNPSRCWYSLNGGTSNSSSVSCGTNFTGINFGAEGEHNITLFMNDSAGNLNSTIIYFSTEIPPNITINQPIGTKNNLTGITFNISLDEAVNDTCIYWIMRGASVEVANTTISCNATMNGTFNVSSDLTNYVFHFWANDTRGNSAEETSNFAVSTTGAPVPSSSSTGGGGGGTIQEDEEVEEVKERACKKSEDNFAAWIKETEGMGLWERIKIGWRLILDLSLCKSQASVFPIDKIET